jgi:hypothetical protein
MPSQLQPLAREASPWEISRNERLDARFIAQLMCEFFGAGRVFRANAKTAAVAEVLPHQSRPASLELKILKSKEFFEKFLASDGRRRTTEGAFHHLLSMPGVAMTDDAPYHKNTQELEPYVGLGGKLTLPQTLIFLKSVIQRGEPWTEECEQAYDAAHSHLNDLADMMNRLLQENRRRLTLDQHPLQLRPMAAASRAIHPFCLLLRMYSVSIHSQGRSPRALQK